MAGKKKYVRPGIHFESLAIGTNISSSCEGIANFAAGLCSVTVNVGFDLEIFQLENVCPYTGPDVNDLVCYHAPSDNNNVFTS